MFTNTVLSTNSLPPDLIDDTSQLLQVTSGIALQDPTLKVITQATVRYWSRRNLERWQLRDVPDDQKPAIINFGTKYHFFEEIKPTKKHYDNVFLLGAAVPSMNKRINYLIELMQQGVTFNHLFLLTATRPLDPAIDIEVPNFCNTEDQAFCWLWRNTKESKNVSWEVLVHPGIPATSLTTPSRRACTTDTYALWLQQNRPPGSILIISSQPFCNAQDGAAKLVIPQEFITETVGKGVNNPTTLNGRTLLDTYATWINFNWSEP